MNAANTNGAGMFESGSENRFEILQMAASDGLAWWAGHSAVEGENEGKGGSYPDEFAGYGNVPP